MSRTLDAPARSAHTARFNHSGWRPVLRPLVATASGSLVANLAIWGVATLAGTTFEVAMPQATTTQAVSPLSVAALSVLSPLVGGLVLTITGDRADVWWPRFAWLGLLVSIVTMPIFMETDVGTRVALSLMHLVVGLLWWMTVRRASDRATS